MENSKLEQDILSHIISLGTKKTLPCAVALMLAKEHAVSPDAIGNYCNQNNIRIEKCQLGCFP